MTAGPLATSVAPLNRREPRLPGDSGVWVFILFDLGFFALLFLSFGLARGDQLATFAASQ